MTSPLVDQIAATQRQVINLQRRRITFRAVTVTATDTVAGTFTGTLPDGQVLSGIATPAQFMPDAGQQVTLQLEGATPRYVPAGVAVGAIGDREVSSMSASRLSVGVISSNMTLAATVLTAASGQRAGLTPLGIQAWDGSNSLSVSLDGVNNLMTGTTQTAIAGRRIVTGAAGNAGRMAFISPDGSQGEVTGYTESGVEAIRLASPVDGAWEGWNSVQAQSSERIYMSTGDIRITYGGDTAGAKQFTVYEGGDSGSPGVQPTRTERLKVDTGQTVASSPDTNTSHQITDGALRSFVGAVASEGSIDVIPHGVADTNLRSPRHQYRMEGGTTAMNVKAVSASGGSSPRIEITNTSDAYAEIRASAFTVSSTSAEKDGIADLTGSALERVRAMTPRTYRRISRAGSITGDDGQVIDIPEQLGPVEIGLVAEESPAEIVHGEAEAINLYSVIALLVGAVKELDGRMK